MNHMMNFPNIVQDKRVFEPFAGSGPLGLMALILGARHVDFLDINPRALSFQRENAAINRLSGDRFTSYEGDIASFVPEQKYDLIVANPPFVPTPEGIRGVITSNCGPEGNRLATILFERLDVLLKESGEAFVYLFQFVKDGVPLIRDVIIKTLSHRQVEITPAQQHPISLTSYCTAYHRLFPEAQQAIESWHSDLVSHYGDNLALSHYVVHIKTEGAGETSCLIRANFAEKFGNQFLVPSDDEDDLVLARVLENIVEGINDRQ